MDFDKVITNRHSVRSFKKKRASWKAVLEAIDAANQGPFAGNHNHLKFLIIEDQNSIEKIAKHAQQTWINEAKLLIIVCSDDTHLENQYGERGRVYSRQQSGAAIQTILLKLTDQKIDSCWVGSYSDELIKQQLEIPQHIQIEAILPVGYASPEKEKKQKKKELENTIYWESWKTTKRPTIFKEAPDTRQRT
jgi:nitroreductase